MCQRFSASAGAADVQDALLVAHLLHVACAREAVLVVDGRPDLGPVEPSVPAMLT